MFFSQQTHSFLDSFSNQLDEMNWTFVFLATLFIHGITATEDYDWKLVITENSKTNKNSTCLKNEIGDDAAIAWEMKENKSDSWKIFEGISYETGKIWPRNEFDGENSFMQPSDGWVKKRNSEFPDERFGSIVDYRWYDLPILKNESLSFNLTTGKNNAFEENFSIVVKSQWLSMKLEADGGSFLTLTFGKDTKKYRKGSDTSRAPESPDDSFIDMQYSMRKNNYSIQTEKPINIIRGLKWSLLSVSMDNNVIKIASDNIRIAFWDFKESTSFKTISFQTYSLKMAIKRHTYDMLVAPSNKVTSIKKTFKVKQPQKLCLSVTYFTPKKSMALKILGTKFETNLEPTGNKWKVQRLVSNEDMSPGVEYRLQIEGKSEPTAIQAIGKVRLCNQTEFLKISATSNEDLLCLSLMKYENMGNTSSLNFIDQMKLRPELQDQVLKALHETNDVKDDSMQMTMTFRSEEQSTCWKGNRGTLCERQCSEGDYGFNCTNQCKHCIGQSCDKSDGKCRNETKCVGDYRLPFCKDELSVVTKEVKINSEGIGSVDVNLTSALETVNENDKRKHLDRIIFHSHSMENKSENETDWPNSDVTTSIPWVNGKNYDKVELPGHRSNTEYEIEVKVCEHNQKDSDCKGSEVRTRIHTQTCSESNNFTGLGNITKNSVELLWSNDKRKHGSCPPEDYLFIVNTKRMFGTYLLKKLDPDTHYNVTFEKTKLQKSFKTREGAPSEVQKLTTVSTEDDSVYSFKWEKPITMNGKLRHYLVSLKHTGFMACENMTGDSSLDKREIKVTDTHVNFTKLELFAKYVLSVAAMTGELGPSSTFPFETAGTESISAAPIISTTNGKHHLEISWEPNCRKAGCKVDKEYRILLLNGNTTIVDNVTEIRNLIRHNLTKGTSYTFKIESRCSGDWKFVGPGFLAFQVTTDLLTGNEIAGTVIGLLILLCISSLTALLIWKYWQSQKKGDTIFKNRSNVDEQTVRYELYPRKYGTSFKKRTIVDHVRYCQDNGILRRQFEAIPKGQLRDWVVGMNEINLYKNRYANMAAYDHTRVVLDGPDDYINANFIGDRNNMKAYIATQGPLQSTTTDFWRMVWQEEVTTIVMLTKLWEKREQCFQYWPDLDASVIYTDILVQNRLEEIFTDHIIRTLVVTGRQGTREIVQLQFTAWSHQGVPHNLPALTNFIAKVYARKKMPLLVHCSGGTGRTGTVILTDLCLRTLVKEKKVNVWSVFKSLRMQRINMVESEQQYELAHQILAQHPQNAILETHGF